MPPEVLEKAAECGFSTKSGGGLGLFLLKRAAESFEISSNERDPQKKHGTTIRALINHLPLGDIGETVAALIQAAPSADILVTHNSPTFRVKFDTREIRAVIGELPMNSPEILKFVKNEFRAQYGRQYIN